MDISEPNSLTNRQQREREFHRIHAEKNAYKISAAVALEVVTSEIRRWWNAYWALYSVIRSKNLTGKRVLVLGCGFGEDAIRLSALGAEVYAIDLSPETIDIARQRVFRDGAPIFEVMSAEALRFQDRFFDAAFFVDILHHVDIPAALAEIARVLKPGAWIFGDELYTHSILQRIRESRIVSKLIYPMMLRYIYRTDAPYITEDEHKIDEREFSLIRRILRPDASIQYFGIAEGRLYPNNYAFLSKIDRALMLLIGPLGRFLASRIVFAGTLSALPHDGR